MLRTKFIYMNKNDNGVLHLNDRYAIIITVTNKMPHFSVLLFLQLGVLRQKARDAEYCFKKFLRKRDFYYGK